MQPSPVLRSWWATRATCHHCKSAGILLLSSHSCIPIMMSWLPSKGDPRRTPARLQGYISSMPLYVNILRKTRWLFQEHFFSHHLLCDSSSAKCICVNILLHVIRLHCSCCNHSYSSYSQKAFCRMKNLRSYFSFVDLRTALYIHGDQKWKMNDSPAFCMQLSRQ